MWGNIVMIFRKSCSETIIESLIFLKWVLSFIFLVNMSLGSMMPGICSMLTSFDWWYYWTIFLYNLNLWSFRCDWSWPLDSGLAVVVDCGPVVLFRRSDFNGSMFDRFKFFGEFIGIHYLYFAGTEVCLILVYQFPGNEITRAAN